jgi:hypothetical protein
VEPSWGHELNHLGDLLVVSKIPKQLLLLDSDRVSIRDCVR